MRSRLAAASLALLTAAAGAGPAAGAVTRPCHAPEILALRALIYEQRAYAAAVERGEELLAEAEAGPGPDSLDAACVLELLGKAMRSAGMLSDGRASEYAERAVTLKSALLGPDHEETVSAESSLAWTLYRKGDVRGSREMFEKVLAARQHIFPPGSIEIAWAHENLGNVQVDLGDYDAAREHLEASARIGERVLQPGDPELASTYRSLSRVLQAAGLLDEAKRQLDKALEIAAKAGPQRDALTTECFISLGVLMDNMGDYLRALDYDTRALALARKRIDDEPLTVATCMNNLARMHRRLRELDKAMAELTEALSIVQERSEERGILAASILFNLGQVSREQGRLDVARAYHEKALAIRRQSLGVDDPSCGSSYEALAGLRSDEGDQRGAIALYEKALAIWRAKLPPNHPDHATSLNGEGVAFAALGELPEAERRFEEAREIRRVALGPRHPLTASATSNLASVLLAEGQRFRALNLAIEAESASRDQVRLVSRELPERVALAYALSRPTSLDTILNIAASHPAGSAVERAWNNVIRSRAIVLDEVASRRHATALSSDPRARAAEGEFAAARRRFAHLTIVGPAPEGAGHYARVLREAEERMEAAETRLMEASPAYRRALEIHGAGLAEVSTALPPTTALVAYVRYRDTHSGDIPLRAWSVRQKLTPSAGDGSGPGLPSYLAFVLPGPGQPPRLVRLGGAAEIDGLVDRWSRSIRSSPGAPGAEAAYREAGERLRERIWDPVALYIGEPTQVLIVPDSAIFLVDFATLPVDESAYLVERAPLLHYLSTERDVVEARRPEPAGNGLLALGGPAFDAPGLFSALEGAASAPSEPAMAKLTLAGSGEAVRGTCPAYRGASFVDLPAARIEAEKIAELWRRTSAGAAAETVLTGPAATEAEFKSMAPGKRILHIATHGFFLGGECKSSSLLSRSASLQDPAQESGARDLVATNPLLLTGFALAGANHRAAAREEEEDGILTAMEIASMDLSATEWAVLAGCETAAGRIETGEGVLGLRRAFRVAGARTIVMSLWSMDDADAMKWMLRLYGHRLADGMSTAEAVRRADLDLLESKRAAGASTHPISWGGWIASGDWQ